MEWVYRIQDSEGRGPFKPGLAKQWVQEREDHENLHPWYVEFGRVDQKLLTGSAGGSACRTIDQLRRWFVKREYKKLKKLGYRACRVPVNGIIAESEIQCFVSKAGLFSDGAEIIKLY